MSLTSNVQSRKRTNARLLDALIERLLVGIQDPEVYSTLRAELESMSELSSVDSSGRHRIVSKMLARLEMPDTVWDVILKNLNTDRTPYSSESEVAGISMKLQGLRDRKLAPSACTWETLYDGGIVMSPEDFTNVKCTLNPVYKESWFEGFNEIAFNHYADDFIGNTTQDNEGWSEGICYPIVAQITRMLNDRAGVPQKYHFKIYPVVKKEKDRRESKFSDISIIKILNRTTKVLIEVKLAVFPRLTISENVLNDFSQLFLEGLYVYEEEKKADPMMLVLTDAICWHIFVVDFGQKPVDIVEYVNISSTLLSQKPTKGTDINVKPVVSKLMHFILSST